MKSLLILFALILPCVANAQEALQTLRSEAPEGASVYFISPQNQAIVCPTFTVRFGLAGMGVAPAGVSAENTGHHHLLIDLEQLPPLDAPLPATSQVRHFGKGQTEAKISLPPGQHSLQLLLANYVHIPHSPPLLSEKISITVSAEKRPDGCVEKE